MLNILNVPHKPNSFLYGTFEDLKADEYLNNTYVYRYRAYSVGDYNNRQLTWRESGAFFQTKDLNSYAGGLKRNFTPLSIESRHHIEEIVQTVVDSQHIPQGNYSIGCHQIRIVAEEGAVGYPAPEGFHQDGFDYLAIYCVSLNNVNGATSLISPLEDENSIYEHTLLPGEIMIVDDRQVKHFVTPITTKIPGREAKRDVFVITFSKLMD
ncbi:2OG-Fe dioxygenase family protein [Vibrio sp. S9_S30]|uniref:2OG-Fe dioxygenase family protein n=1 Tax=Vibrio sp. S9_S30 TaxID=2720226 RepID=UPI001680089C|nr:2OG-Fe dioxygenase family protein [Vibrio sp. S9_S30]MBD1557131.1 2OG-Fe dioxygenase family protein [Vibrio sp. S9_S30]